MAADNSGNGRPYREKLYCAAVGLHRNLRYLVFIYVIGTALAAIAVACTSGATRPGLSLGFVLAAYGIAALAVAIFVYAFVQLALLSFCAFAEWLREQHDGDSFEDEAPLQQHDLPHEGRGHSAQRHPTGPHSVKR